MPPVGVIVSAARQCLSELSIALALERQLLECLIAVRCQFFEDGGFEGAEHRLAITTEAVGDGEMVAVLQCLIGIDDISLDTMMVCEILRQLACYGGLTTVHEADYEQGACPHRALIYFVNV